MITYQEETMDSFLVDAEKLLLDHFKEVAIYNDRVKYSPDFHRYQILEEMGCLLIFTVREEGKLIGYTVTIINPHIHYSKDCFGVNDILYVAPSHRHTEVPKRLIEGNESILKEEGVNVCTYSMKAYRTFETLMKSCGYDRAEIVYSKYIGEEDG